MNYNLGKLVRGEMIIGKAERESMWLDEGKLLEFFFDSFSDQPSLIFSVMILTPKIEMC